MDDGPARPKRVRGERQRLQDARWRHSKKQERQGLKATAQKLKTQLSQLQQDGNRCVAASPVAKRRKNCCNWQEKAETVKQERIHAELLNVALRKAGAEEQRVAKSLRALMDNRPRMPVALLFSSRGERKLGFDLTVAVLMCGQRSLVYDMRPRASCSQAETYAQVPQCLPCCNPTTLHVNPAAVRREIEATLQRMHGQVNAVLHSGGGDDSLAFKFNVRVNPAAGPTTEVMTTTPMNCSLDQAVKLLGPKFQTQGPVDLGQPRCVQEPRHRGRDAHEQQFTVELGAPYQTVLLDGLGATRQSDEENHYLILWAAISFDRCGALCFREFTWLAVHRSHSNPTSDAVIRSHYSVTAEKAVGCVVVDGEHIDRVRDRLQTSMGRKIKERYLVMQRDILVQTGRADLGDFVGL